MTESPPLSKSPQHHVTTSSTSTRRSNHTNTIPVEIISQEEMALIGTAIATTRSICPPPQASVFQRNAIHSITSLPERSLIDGCSQQEIEDLGGLRRTQPRNPVDKSIFNRFRKKTGLYVTDLTSTEWCEKQTEFSCRFSQRTTDAMKAGKVRHLKLEEEVFKKVNVSVESNEDAWALKFMNFITGANQLLFEGLTRELPVIGFVEGVWIVGKIDEIRMQEATHRIPVLVDTKTRARDTLPGESQRRNGRLQLMCYKSLWDKAAAIEFPLNQFFNSFSLNRHYILSEEIRQGSARAGIPANTLDDILNYYRNTCSMLLPADNQLLLRYESQKDCSLLDEDQFPYDPDWLNSRIRDHLEFWLGQREANYVPQEERWKCHGCQFADVCPFNAVSDSPSSAKT